MITSLRQIQLTGDLIGKIITVHVAHKYENGCYSNWREYKYRIRGVSAGIKHAGLDLEAVDDPRHCMNITERMLSLSGYKFEFNEPETTASP